MPPTICICDNDQVTRQCIFQVLAEAGENGAGEEAMEGTGGVAADGMGEDANAEVDMSMFDLTKKKKKKKKTKETVTEGEEQQEGEGNYVYETLLERIQVSMHAPFDGFR